MCIDNLLYYVQLANGQDTKGNLNNKKKLIGLLA